MELSKDEIMEVMDEVIENFIIPIFESEDMNATGEWRENIHSDATLTEGIIVGRSYSIQLDKGRAPSDRMPPVSALERWAKAKLGLQGQQARSAAFGIATKIQSEGTNYYQQGGTDLIDIITTDEVINFVKDKFGEIIKREAIIEVKKYL